LLVGNIILSLGGRWFALLLGFLPFIFGVYLRVHYLFQPNFLEVFFWTMIVYAIIKYTQTKQNKWLYIFGISAGLGMLSKYSVAFFITGIIAGLALTKQRKIFLNQHLYYAVTIAIILFLPNAVWQYQNNFPVLFHMQKLQDTQLQYISPLSFLMDQLLMHLPAVFIWIAGLGFVFFVDAKRYLFVGIAYTTVIVLLILLHGKNYYSLGSYPVLFAFGGYYLEKITSAKFKALRIAFILFPVLLGIIFTPVALPVASPQHLEQWYKKTGMDKTGALKWEDLQAHPLPQDFADMLGWEEMTQKVATAYHSLSDNEKNRTVLFADNYGQAGAINYYASRYNLPQCYSDNASFLYWIPHPMHIDNIILITNDKDEMQYPFIKDFVSAKLIDSVENNYAREKGSLIILLKGANENFNKMFQKKIEDDFAEIRGKIEK
jgi:hypothetical protein